MKKIVIGITGASGIRYALKIIDVLKRECDLCVIYTRAARLVMMDEEGIDISEIKERHGDVKFYDESDFSCKYASGSQRPDAVIVCPCSAATLSSVANGLSSNLLERVCDVALKEGVKLILVFRETPLNLIHIENMKKVAMAGGIILPACPGFYNKPKSVEDMVDFVVAKTLKRIGIDSELLKPWEGDNKS
ncbi:3-octaprenyl-4-hydroxybenzoate carboxy-lyase [Thermodesulfobium narugense DSM 14796]|uniref:Flavin prenyltransferase UbiX n=1 Tax=Thermodesulfobium narugense DSM 14796 TaxID=747365 RepID=M1E8B7_9BACT|nr:UbiX family flavin prenyltransferase [Thermodesulfobium narugense]AEE15088.1 3-octaprenyl-4-hydroxybenzoate carboxy-lyase [Thermodesulfobium narugense DSM 14796]